MTKDDIIKLAREAGLHLYVNDLTEEPYALVVERFANLVAEREREECAKVAEGTNGTAGANYLIAKAIRMRGD